MGTNPDIKYNMMITQWANSLEGLRYQTKPNYLNNSLHASIMGIVSSVLLNEYFTGKLTESHHALSPSDKQRMLTSDKYPDMTTFQNSWIVIRLIVISMNCLPFSLP